MQNFKNFTLYTHEYADLVMPNAYFLQTEDGQDWYYNLQKFSDDTVKVAYDSAGVVRALSTDATTLWPVNLSVTELTADCVAEGADASGNWSFNGSAVVARIYTSTELLEKAESKRSQLISDARETMQEWQTDLALGEISDADKVLLRTWNSYVKALKALDLSVAPDINWPEIPATTN